jgi:hypothetical protein
MIDPDRIFDRVVAAMDRRTPRRRFLARFATAASALAVAPWRYVSRPVSAVDVVTCSSCAPGSLCCDGWTTFCCTINGGLNQCPANTFMGGWWKCTNYTGSRLCASEGVRYYVDCNRTPTTSCPSGCHCAHDNCGNRSTCCNVFRYGQCNTEVLGTTEVVCRMITCQSPGELFVNCNSTLFIENATCSHEASCL